jgi:prephenate dehydrogenase
MDTRCALDKPAVLHWRRGVIDHLAILAPGLLGGSVAQAARRTGAARRIAVWARRPETRLKLQHQPWCDEVHDTPAGAVRGAQLVVICTPVDTIVALAAIVAPHLAPGAVVTDVGSVKAEICRLAPAAMPPGAHFVGSHPMAGSEQTGWEHARPDLFSRRTIFVTPRPETDTAAVARVVAFWSALEADVVTVPPDTHDEIVAHISHLPQVLASTLCAHLQRRDPAWRNFAGGGLRDTTRIAGSDPRLWKTILEQNRDEVLRALRAYQEDLHHFQIALANRHWLELQAILERGQAYRNQFRPPPQS